MRLDRETTEHRQIPSRLPMLRFIVLALFTAMLVPALCAETVVVDGLRWESPRVLAQGSSSAGIAGGWDALFANPALFTTEDIEITAISLSVGGRPDPTAPEEPMSSRILRQIVDDGRGGRVQLGYGLVGRGWGLGFAGVLRGESEDPASGLVDLHVDAGLTIGYARQIRRDELRLAVGGDLRPLVRLEAADLSVATLDAAASDPRPMATLMNEMETVDAGWGIGVDVGGSAAWRDFRASMVLRDIGHTRYLGYRGAVDDLRRSDVGALTPMTLRTGFAYDPIGEKVDPVFHVESIIPLAGADIREDAGYATALGRLNFGAEARIMEVFTVRAGLCGGQPSAGLGLDLHLFEVNAAFRVDRPDVDGRIEIAARY